MDNALLSSSGGEGLPPAGVAVPRSCMQAAMSQGNSRDRATWIDASRSPNRSAPGRGAGAVAPFSPSIGGASRCAAIRRPSTTTRPRPRPRPTSTISFEISAYGGDPVNPAERGPAMRRTAASRDSNIFS